MKKTKHSLLERVRLNEERSQMGMVERITLPAELHYELVAEVERREAEEKGDEA